MAEGLFDQIVKNTGLPEDLVTQDFLKILNSKGLDKSTVTIDELREVLAEYLQDVILSVKDKYK